MPSATYFLTRESMQRVFKGKGFRFPFPLKIPIPQTTEGEPMVPLGSPPCPAGDDSFLNTILYI